MSGAPGKAGRRLTCGFAAGGFLLICLMAAGVTWHGFGRQQLELPNGYCWRETGPSRSVIENRNREILVGPGMLELWARGPVIYGHEAIGKNFILSTDSGRLERFDGSELEFNAVLRARALPELGTHAPTTQVNLYEVTVSRHEYDRSERFFRALEETAVSGASPSTAGAPAAAATPRPGNTSGNR